MKKQNNNETINLFKLPINKINTKLKRLNDIPYDEVKKIIKNDPLIALISRYVSDTKKNTFNKITINFIKSILDNIYEININNYSTDELKTIIINLDMIAKSKNAFPITKYKELYEKRLKELEVDEINIDFNGTNNEITKYFIELYIRFKNIDRASDSLNKLYDNIVSKLSINNLKEIINNIDNSNMDKLENKIRNDYNVLNYLFIKSIINDKFNHVVKLNYDPNEEYNKMFDKIYKEGIKNDKRVFYHLIELYNRELYNLTIDNIKYLYDILQRVNFEDHKNLRKQLRITINNYYNFISIYRHKDKSSLSIILDYLDDCKYNKEYSHKVLIDLINTNILLLSINDLKTIKHGIIINNRVDTISKYIDEFTYFFSLLFPNHCDYDMKFGNNNYYIMVENYIRNFNFLDSKRINMIIPYLEMLYKNNIITREKYNTSLNNINNRIKKYYDNGIILSNYDDEIKDIKKIRGIIENLYLYPKKIKNLDKEYKYTSISSENIFTVDKECGGIKDDAINYYYDKYTKTHTVNLYLADVSPILKSSNIIRDKVLSNLRSITFGKLYNLYPDDIIKEHLSLNEEEDKVALHVQMVFDSNYNILSFDIDKSLINPVTNLSFEKANYLYFNAREKDGSYEDDIKSQLYSLVKLSNYLSKKIGYIGVKGTNTYKMITILSIYANYLTAKEFEIKELPYISYFVGEEKYNIPEFSVTNKGNLRSNMDVYTRITSPIRRSDDSYMHELINDFLIEEKVDFNSIQEKKEEMKELVYKLNKRENELKKLGL